MESDYIHFKHKDLLTLRDVRIKDEEATTYIHIEGPKKQFQIYGNLTYRPHWKGNNWVISLLGALNVKFFDLEGEEQIVKIQFPDFVISGYIYVGQPRMVLIDGPLVLYDKENALKAVVFFSGL